MMKLLLSIFTVFLMGLSSAHADDLTLVDNFGSNPGGIKMYKYVPRQMPSDAPLVVALHGCLQDAETYADVGWIALAEQWKFYVVFPQQDTGNNPYGCWNWFRYDDTQRGHGEAKSIMEMVAKMKADHSIDESRIYIEGLSAGGWMVSVMLASYPDVFAGGATQAGGPAFCASVGSYFWDPFGWWSLWSGGLRSKKCMGGIDQSPVEWGDLVKDKGYDGNGGRWPILSIWQGSADETVDMINQQELVDQWAGLHGIDLIPDKEEKVGPNAKVIHKEYHNSEGRALVETYLIPGMKHGAPITVDAGHSCGEERDFILNEGICGVRQIGLFWGLGR